jgi:DNA repair exonuclease SbcCD ATPase subunit
MTDIYSLEDKISNIRKVVRNLTGDNYSTFDYKPSLLKEIDSNSSRSLRNSLENYLENKYEDAENYASRPYQSRVPDFPTNPTLDYSKDEKPSSSSFKGPFSNKIMTSFLSDEFSSLKFNEKEASDLGALLDHEKENSKRLEQRLLQKDEIISAMNQRQSALTEELAGLRRSSQYQQIEEYKVMISNLQEKLEKYSNQVTFLQNRTTPEFKKNFDEEFSVKVASLERQLKDQEELIQDLHNKNSRIKQDQIFIADLKAQIEKKDRNLAEVVNENKEINARLSEVSKKDPRQDFREFKLKEEVTRLKLVNEELFEKFKRIESESSKTRIFKSRDVSVEPTKNYSNERGRRTRQDKTPENRKRSCSYHKTLNEITQLLHCSSSEILVKIKKLKRSQKLEEKLTQLISDLTLPMNNGNGEMTTKHIWKCITKLVEEYLNIKKSENGSSDKIAKLLGVRTTDTLDEVKRLVDEKRNMSNLVEKIKKMLCLKPSAPLREVEDTIDEKV